MDCSLPGSSIHENFQARVLKWVAISFSRGSSWPRYWTQVSPIVGRHFTVWATREVSKGSRIWEALGKEAQGSSRGSHSEWTDSVSLCRMWEDLVSIVFIISISVKILMCEFNMLCITTFHKQIFNQRSTYTPQRKLNSGLRWKKKKNKLAAVVIFSINAFSYSYSCIPG